jgi:sec-independent protein translocase protein TatA
MGGLGPKDMIVIVVVILVLFGPSRIGDFAKELGKSVSMFKKGLKEGMEDDEAPKKDAAVKKDDAGPLH